MLPANLAELLIFDFAGNELLILGGKINALFANRTP